MPQIRFGISQVRFGTWSSLEHDHPQSKFPVWDVPNRNSDLGYPKFDLGYGQVWATTDLFRIAMKLRRKEILCGIVTIKHVRDVKSKNSVDDKSARTLVYSENQT